MSYIKIAEDPKGAVVGTYGFYKQLLEHPERQFKNHPLFTILAIKGAVKGVSEVQKVTDKPVGGVKADGGRVVDAQGKALETVEGRRVPRSGLTLRQTVDVAHALKDIAKHPGQHEDFTLPHTMRVAKYAKSLAKELGLTKAEVEKVTAGAVIHDLGKAQREIQPLLVKKGITQAEMRKIETHPYWGVEFAKDMGVKDRTILNIIGRHHEGTKGGGYSAFGSPSDAFRQIGEDQAAQIGPREALYVQIVSVADAYEAMTSPLRKRTIGRGGISPQEAIRELRIDPKLDSYVVGVFINMLQETGDLHHH
jgi:putative nucleotidyltransferase with HDIG domain